jgi:hypothetical protein
MSSTLAGIHSYLTHGVVSPSGHTTHTWHSFFCPISSSSHWFQGCLRMHWLQIEGCLWVGYILLISRWYGYLPIWEAQGNGLEQSRLLTWSNHILLNSRSMLSFTFFFMVSIYVGDWSSHDAAAVWYCSSLYTVTESFLTHCDSRWILLSSARFILWSALILDVVWLVACHSFLYIGGKWTWYLRLLACVLLHVYQTEA